MWYVYIIKSLTENFIYIGSTNSIERRLNEHNCGLCLSTKHYKPFELEAFIAVKAESKAKELEKYLKTGSGRAILKKRILVGKASVSSVLTDPALSQLIPG
ncbi:MAG TPA: GIY-YIG nuclease family protein [Ignavibacteriaceae bacterium]|nr:GIY-YIG nuclease family protein [Ignavibacteriaceae bacterium]